MPAGKLHFFSLSVKLWPVIVNFDNKLGLDRASILQHKILHDGFLRSAQMSLKKPTRLTIFKILFYLKRNQPTQETQYIHLNY